jgi:hypothetical protein
MKKSKKGSKRKTSEAQSSSAGMLTPRSTRPKRTNNDANDESIANPTNENATNNAPVVETAIAGETVAMEDKCRKDNAVDGDDSIDHTAFADTKEKSDRKGKL